jgi:hypothetical protein
MFTGDSYTSLGKWTETTRTVLPEALAGSALFPGRGFFCDPRRGFQLLNPKLKTYAPHQTQLSDKAATLQITMLFDIPRALHIAPKASAGSHSPDRGFLFHKFSSFTPIHPLTGQ